MGFFLGGRALPFAHASVSHRMHGPAGADTCQPWPHEKTPLCGVFCGWGQSPDQAWAAGGRLPRTGLVILPLKSVQHSRVKSYILQFLAVSKYHFHEKG